MQKFLSLLFSRRALAVVGVVALALLVWFIGPLVAFDTLHPLASVGSRVVTIVLLLMFLALWLVNWSMSIIGVTVLCWSSVLFRPCWPSVTFARLLRCGCV